jgi:exodeoxyribonuclease-3
MKLVSWNVNGIRSCEKKGFVDSIKKLNPEIFCLQETKINEKLHLLNLEEYKSYWNFAEKKGYAGTAIFTKEEPIAVTYGMNFPEHDDEGRVITAEYKNFFLVTVYTPNAQRGLARIDYRVEWNEVFLAYVKNLEKTKPVIFCGDLNVAHTEIDLANPQSNKTTASRLGNAGFSDAERKGFDDILAADFIDTFRHLHPDKIQYTWWSYMFNARAKNIGWRIDYFCISDTLKDKLKTATCHTEILGSDHCPVSIDINI